MSEGMTKAMNGLDRLLAADKLSDLLALSVKYVRQVELGNSLKIRGRPVAFNSAVYLSVYDKVCYVCMAGAIVATSGELPEEISAAVTGYELDIDLLPLEVSDRLVAIDAMRRVQLRAAAAQLRKPKELRHALGKVEQRWRGRLPSKDWSLYEQMASHIARVEG